MKIYHFKVCQQLSFWYMFFAVLFSMKPTADRDKYDKRLLNKTKALGTISVSLLTECHNSFANVLGSEVGLNMKVL